MSVHQQVLVSIQGRLIENLMTTLEVISCIAHRPTGGHSMIATIADNAMEATKALNVKGLSHVTESSPASLCDQENP